MTVPEIADILGGKELLERDIETASDLATVTREGFLSLSLDRLATALNVQRGAVANLLGVSERTLSGRRSAQSRLTPIESDRVVRLARIMAQAQETLGDLDRAGQWLKTPNRALGGDRPLDRLDTDTGVRAVEQVLGRIEYGLYS